MLWGGRRIKAQFFKTVLNHIVPIRTLHLGEIRKSDFPLLPLSRLMNQCWRIRNWRSKS
jgi:hypothetical protein